MDLKYRVRRLGDKHFRIIKNGSGYLESEKGFALTFDSHASALKRIKQLESGTMRDPCPVIED